MIGRVRGQSRLKIRTRLALSYAGLVTLCGAVLIAVVYLFMRFVPTYRTMAVAQAEVAPPEARTPAVPGRPAAVQISSAEDFLNTLLVASGVALIVLVVIAGATGWLVAGRIVKPLAVINAAANRAATGSLDHRVAMDGPGDEIKDLSDTFDRMLSSLQRSFDAHRRFAANASHELRTPLATAKTMIDVGLAEPDLGTAQYRVLVGRLGEVNRACLETVDALLDLADADSGTASRIPVPLAPLAAEVVAELSPLAARLHVDFAVPTGRAVAVGDPVLLRQAVGNLVRNALMHNRAGGRASLHLESDGQVASVVVDNTGPVVDADTLGDLTEPFVRGVGRSLTRGRGHGLGLSIVAAVVEASGGALDLTARPEGGLTVRLDLPAFSAGSGERT